MATKLHKRASDAEQVVVARVAAALARRCIRSPTAGAPCRTGSHSPLSVSAVACSASWSRATIRAVRALGTLRDETPNLVERLLRVRRGVAVARAFIDRRRCRVEQRKFAERRNPVLPGRSGRVPGDVGDDPTTARERSGHRASPRIALGVPAPRCSASISEVRGIFGRELSGHIGGARGKEFDLDPRVGERDRPRSDGRVQRLFELRNGAPQIVADGVDEKREACRSGPRAIAG